MFSSIPNENTSIGLVHVLSLVVYILTVSIAPNPLCFLVLLVEYAQSQFRPKGGIVWLVMVLRKSHFGKMLTFSPA